MSADGSLRHPRPVLPSGHTIVRLRGALDVDAAPALRERLIALSYRDLAVAIARPRDGAVA